MLSPRSRLVPNEEECAAKVIDGEAVIINLSNGTYYSMGNVGGFIWSMVAEGRPLEDIVEGVAARYDVTSERALEDARRLLDELVAEKLVRPAVGDTTVPTALPSPIEKQVYEEPRLNSYRDMADLLALDPPMPGLKEVPWQEPAAPAPSSPKTAI
jgi:Coenzyme PQQ synthesis protein D (PqqD)